MGSWSRPADRREVVARRGLNPPALRRRGRRHYLPRRACLLRGLSHRGLEFVGADLPIGAIESRLDEQLVATRVTDDDSRPLRTAEVADDLADDRPLDWLNLTRHED